MTDTLKPAQDALTWLEWRNPRAQEELRQQLKRHGIEWTEMVIEEDRPYEPLVRFCFVDPVDEVRHGAMLIRYMMGWFERMP